MSIFKWKKPAFNMYRYAFEYYNTDYVYMINTFENMDTTLYFFYFTAN